LFRGTLIHLYFLALHFLALLIDFRLDFGSYRRSILSQGLGGFISRLFIANVIPMAILATFFG
jgi:hypothetical protein